MLAANTIVEGNTDGDTASEFQIQVAGTHIQAATNLSTA